MEIKCRINGNEYKGNVEADMTAIDFLRAQGCYSVKRGCGTSDCGLCSILVNDKAVLSCSVLAPSLNGKDIYTLEGLQEEAKLIGGYLAAEGTEQCGYCTPGFTITVIAMERELKNPSDDEILSYLAGNLCRCSGYQGQIRAIRNYYNEVKNDH
jgi:carbon-monoxide dehydrogenase small subunit